MIKELNPTFLKYISTSELDNNILKIGYFANVINIGSGLGIAIATDGVGSKILLAKEVGDYSTIGIDCVAMNVNDIICVGAKPLSLVDYIGIENPDDEVLNQIVFGLAEGAKQAGINISGGETAHLENIINGVDLVGTCIGIVPLDNIIVGADVKPDDVIIGLRSNGIHSNGFTIIRKNLKRDSKVINQMLLTPTKIYAKEVMGVIDKKLPVKALANITGGGLLNLTRIEAPVSFRIDNLPKPHPIFNLIQKASVLSDLDMYQTFNMGIGFCIIAPNDKKVVSNIRDTIESYGTETYQIGRVIEGSQRSVYLDFGELKSNDRQERI